MTNESHATDHDWEQWGQKDPYFAVITDPRFRRDRLSEADRDWFFETGRAHVDYVMHMCRKTFDYGFLPQSVLDFGCGVGRTLIRFSQAAGHAVGVDVSAAMLEEARANCVRLGVGNVELVQSGDAEVLVGRTFDLVHSVIVLQHVVVERGIALFGRLVSLVSPRGIGAIQVTYAKSIHAATLGVPPLPAPAAPEVAPSLLPFPRRAKGPAGPPPQPAAPPEGDPRMQMNSYPLNPLMFQLQAAGVRHMHVEFTDHAGELGLFIYFQRA